MGLLGRYAYRQRGWDEWAWSRYDQPAYVEGTPYLGGSVDYALPIDFDETWGITAHGTRMLGESSILELRADRSEFFHWRRVRDQEGGYIGEGLTPAAWFGEYLPERVADSLGFFHAGIHSAVWLESRSSVWSGKTALTSQLSRILKLKAGIEASFYDLYDFDVTASGPAEVWVSNWRADPLSWGAYLQTTANFSGAMVLNTGLRLDAFIPNTDMVLPGTPGPVDVPSKVQVSPRVGMTHPISERDVFFATYGRYFQMPSMDQMFSGTSYNLSGDYTIVGNPDLDAVRTISMEAGIRHRIDDLSTLSFSAFSKQITGLVQTAPLSGDGLEHFFLYENDDSYATVQGAELSVMRLPGRTISGSVSWAYMVARGRYSSATESYEYASGGLTGPEEDGYLDWDQRHAVNVHLCYGTGRGEGPRIAGGHPLEGLLLSLDGSYGSGFPFTPASEDSMPDVNAERYPGTLQADLGIAKRFWAGETELELSLTVYNLLDRDDIVRIYDPGLYMVTGNPGGIMDDPAAYAPARHVFLRLGVRW